MIQLTIVLQTLLVNKAKPSLKSLETFQQTLMRAQKDSHLIYRTTLDEKSIKIGKVVGGFLVKYLEEVLGTTITPK